MMPLHDRSSLASVCWLPKDCCSHAHTCSSVFIAPAETHCQRLHLEQKTSHRQISSITRGAQCHCLKGDFVWSGMQPLVERSDVMG